MNKRKLLFLFLLLVVKCIHVEAQEQTYEKVLLLMGSRFEITAISDDKHLALTSIEAAMKEIERIEKLISSWDSLSETSLVNKNAGIKPVKVSRELSNLIGRSMEVSKLTDGAFDVTFASLDRVWKFDGSMNELPSDELVRASVSKISYLKIIRDIESNTVFLSEKDMKIGFGAIGKGYAADKAKEVMKGMGIDNGLVNAGGDLIAWGSQEDGKPWQIGIADPNDKSGAYAWLSVSDMAVVTSGNYEKFVDINGKRYAHIIDPRTGYPATGIRSVTVVCPSAELADALATAVFVLGEIKGLDLINQLNGIECFIINENNEIQTSANLELNYYPDKSIEEFDFKIGTKE